MPWTIPAHLRLSRHAPTVLGAVLGCLCLILSGVVPAAASDDPNSVVRNFEARMTSRWSDYVDASAPCGRRATAAWVR